MGREQIYQQVRQELQKNFRKKPIEDVGRILTIVQGFQIKESEIISLAQACYTKLFVELKKGDANNARQSWVVASGNNFENLIRHSLMPL